jgi:hypothetical protein
MWPWGHVAVAYLLYTAFTRGYYGDLPRGGAVLALVFGSQFPDLLDKPLGWSLSILPGGRTLGHSIFFAIVVLSVVSYLASRYQHSEAATAFAIGYVVHLATDLPLAIFSGDFSDTTFLFWPVLEQPEYANPGGILEGFLRYSTGTYEWIQLGLVVLAFLVWYQHKKPGVAYIRVQIKRFFPAREPG